jgi:hypothetical protein
VSVNHFQGRGTLLLESLKALDFGLVGLEQSITANIREGRGKIKHFLFGEEETIPKFL